MQLDPSLQEYNIDQLMQNAWQINYHAVGYLVHGACRRSPVQCRNEYNKFTCSQSLLCPAGLPIVQHFAAAQINQHHKPCLCTRRATNMSHQEALSDPSPMHAERLSALVRKQIWKKSSCRRCPIHCAKCLETCVQKRIP